MQAICYMAWTLRPTGQHPDVSPMLGVHHDGSRVGHLALDEGLAGLGGLLQPGHADGLLGPVVGPVEVTSDPVHRDALHCVDACSTSIQVLLRLDLKARWLNQSDRSTVPSIRTIDSGSLHDYYCWAVRPKIYITVFF